MLKKFTKLNIFELKINLDTNIAEMKTVVLEQSMLNGKPPPKRTPPVQPPIETQQQPFQPFQFQPTQQQQSSQQPSTQNSGKVENIYAKNKYPFFTYDVEYPKEILKTFSYNEVIEFFFNKEKFTDTLTDLYLQNNNNVDNSVANTYEQRNEIIDNNIIMMLSMLFPTKYPVANNIGNSYDYIMSKYPYIKQHTIQYEFPARYSYIKFPFLKDKRFTVTKVMWENDFLNHPDYTSIIREFISDKRKMEYKLKEMTIRVDKYGKQRDATGDAERKLQFDKKIDELAEEANRINDKIKNPFEQLNRLIRSSGIRDKKSTNILLQDLLDEQVSKIEYNKFLQYMVSFVTDEVSEYKLTDDEKKEYAELMDVGITQVDEILNENSGDTITNKTAEIHIMIDLTVEILDEKTPINDCKHKSEYLGNELDAYLNERSMSAVRRTQESHLVADWNIHRNRSMIYLGEKYVSQIIEMNKNTTPKNPFAVPIFYLNNPTNNRMNTIGGVIRKKNVNSRRKKSEKMKKNKKRNTKKRYKK